MSMIASDNGGVSIPKLEGGVYTATSSAIIDLGIQTSEKYGTTQRRFVMIWDILGEEIEINKEKYPRTITKEYSFSLGEKSNLKKDLQAWRNKPFTQEELEKFDLLNILNKSCQLQILLEEKNGKLNNNIAGIMSLPKGTAITELNKKYHFDITNRETWSNWGRIPKWIQEKIKKADNYEESGLKGFIDIYETTEKSQNDISETTEELFTADDLPF